MERIEEIEKELAHLKEAVAQHEVYGLLKESDDVRSFMESHVFAVWDFMSLLKSLQRHLTCVSVPWQPVKNTKVARFINEIVLGEESDLDRNGITKSHFEMYLAAMEEVGADTTRVKALVQELSGPAGFEFGLDSADLFPAEKAFLTFTFNVIASNEPHKIAAAFTFGREDVIPDMFVQMVKSATGGMRFGKFIYYLERHIELDGDEHGPLSLEMVKELCGESEQKWKEALEVAQWALLRRIELWDEVASRVKEKRQELALP